MNEQVYDTINRLQRQVAEANVALTAANERCKSWRRWHAAQAEYEYQLVAANTEESSDGDREAYGEALEQECKARNALVECGELSEHHQPEIEREAAALAARNPKTPT